MVSVDLSGVAGCGGAWRRGGFVAVASRLVAMASGPLSLPGIMGTYPRPGHLVLSVATSFEKLL